MKRMNLKEMMSFVIFDHPLDINCIRAHFVQLHSRYEQRLPNWTFQATRRVVVTDYWFPQVLLHFLIVIVFSFIITMPFYNNWSTLLPSFFVGTLISFVTLMAFIYFPTYYSQFLPKLDTIIAQQQKLSIQAEETKKCKRTQFQIPTLIAIYYTLSKTSGISLPPANDSSAELLNKLFGCDKDKLKQNLSRLYKISRLSPKERAELLKGIDNAREYLIQLGCLETPKALDELELKLKRKQPS